jgi:hypothetical protein
MLRGPLGRLVAATVLVLLCAPATAAVSGYSQTIFRSSAFSTQATDSFCTAAVIEQIRNLAVGESRHSRAHQTEIYTFGRSHNRFAYRSAGVDPQGVEATLERYVPRSDWRQIRTTSLQAVLQIAARHMRATGLPAVLFVAGGKHVWTMNGYIATADPGSGRPFRVTYVRFSGPYYPKQTALYGWFDLHPNSVRSVERLAEAYFPYRESLAFGDGRATPWNGSFVAVVPWTIDRSDPGGTPNPTPSTSPTESSPSTSTPAPTPTSPTGTAPAATAGQSGAPEPPAVDATPGAPAPEATPAPAPEATPDATSGASAPDVTPGTASPTGESGQPT